MGFYVNKVKNVIIRNLSISKVLAENGDAIGIQASQNVWVDVRFSGVLGGRVELTSIARRCLI